MSHRLLANVAISPSAGPTLAASSAVSEPLLDMLGAKRISDSEELVGDPRGPQGIQPGTQPGIQGGGTADLGLARFFFLRHMNFRVFWLSSAKNVF